MAEFLERLSWGLFCFLFASFYALWAMIVAVSYVGGKIQVNVDFFIEVFAIGIVFTFILACFLLPIYFGVHGWRTAL